MRDTSLIVQIQIALIGIVVVLGMFYMWRAIARLELRINDIAVDCCMCPGKETSCIAGDTQCKGPNPHGGAGSDTYDEPYMEEQMMKVFSVRLPYDNDTVVPSSAIAVTVSDAVSTPSVVEPPRIVTMPKDIATFFQSESPPEVDASTSNVDDDAVSAADTDATNPLSKTKLKRMSNDALKVLCRERDLQVDGSKSVLIDRLLGLVR